MAILLLDRPVVDPRAGFVANWNTKPARGWFDGDLSGSNSRPGGAAQRMAIIRKLLKSSHNLKPSDLLRLDTRIGAADMRAIGYLPAMLRLRGAAGLTKQQRNALQLLASWDGRAYAPGEPGGSSPETKDPADVTDGPAATYTPQPAESTINESAATTRVFRMGA